MASRKPASCRRYVDMWALPGVHPCNAEFLQKMKSADTNHFTTNMDVVGTVSQQILGSRKWEKTHMIGVRTDIWKPDEEELQRSLEVMQEKRQEELRRSIKRSGRLNQKQSDQLSLQLTEDSMMEMKSDDIEKRRLVLKLFKTTGTRVRWCGTIEEVTITEIHNSLGSRRSLITLAVMLPKTELITYIQQNHQAWRPPAIFSFSFIEGRTVRHMVLRRRWLGVGADFDVWCDNQKIGLIDGRLFGFGSDSYLNLSEHELSVKTPFVDILTLFASSVGYHKAMRRSIKGRVKANRSGQGYLHLIEDEEIRLRNNGRAA